jgi:putative transposase
MQSMSPPDGRRKTLRHFEVPGHAHFLTFSCYQRLPLLSKDRTRRWFIDSLEKARQSHHFDLWAWVIMPEHIHLLIYPREPNYRMAAILTTIKKPVGYKAIRYLREHAPEFLNRLTITRRGRTRHHFWQAGAGYDKNLYDAPAIQATADYIHSNPVGRGLVTRAEDWHWSSAGDWSGVKDVPIRVDRTMPSVVVASG